MFGTLHALDISESYCKFPRVGKKDSTVRLGNCSTSASRDSHIRHALAPEVELFRLLPIRHSICYGSCSFTSRDCSCLGLLLLLLLFFLGSTSIRTDEQRHKIVGSIENSGRSGRSSSTKGNPWAVHWLDPRSPSRASPDDRAEGHLDNPRLLPRPWRATRRT